MVAFHPLIKQVPEELTAVSPLCIPVVGEGGNVQICLLGFDTAYSAAWVLLFQIPAKMRAWRRSQASGHPLDRSYALEERNGTQSFSITTSTPKNHFPTSYSRGCCMNPSPTPERTPTRSAGTFAARELHPLEDAAETNRPGDKTKQQDPNRVLPEERNTLVIPQSSS